MLRQCPRGHWTAAPLLAECHECRQNGTGKASKVTAVAAVAAAALVLPATSLAAKPNPIAHSGHSAKAHICPIAHSVAQRY